MDLLEKFPLFINVPFYDWERLPAKQFYDWYVANISERIQVLEKDVQKFYPEWCADLSPDSLKILGEWIQRFVVVKQLSEEERREYYKDAPKWIQMYEEPPKEILDERSYSTVCDISLYLAAILQRDFPHFSWEFLTKPKNDEEFQAPVLRISSKMIFPPITIAHVIALNAMREGYDEMIIFKTYNIWVDLINKLK